MSDRKRCHRSIEYSAGFASNVKAVECIGDECALWDGVHGCCGDMSMVMEGRAPILKILAEMVDDFREGTKKISDDLEHEDLAPEGKGFKRGQRNILDQVIFAFHCKFGV